MSITSLPAWPLALAGFAACLIAPFSAPAVAPVVVVCGMAGWALLLRHQTLPVLIRLTVIRILGAVFTIVLASALWSASAAASLRAFLGLGGVLLMGMALISLALQACPEPDRRWQALFLAAFGVLLLVLLEEHQSGGMLHNLLDRMTGGGGGRWQASSLNRATVLASLLLWPALLLARHGRMPLMVQLALVFGTLALVLQSTQVTATPALLLGLGAAAAVYSLPRLGVALLVLPMALITLVLPLVPGRFITAAEVSARWPDLRFSMLHRLNIWEFAAARIAERPWLGWGLDGVRSLPGGDETFFSDAKFMPIHPHNGILHIWLELGAVGAALLFALLLVIWQGLRQPRLNRFDRALAAGLFATAMVFFCVAFGVWQNWWVATLCLAGATMIRSLRPGSPEN